MGELVVLALIVSGLVFGVSSVSKLRGKSAYQAFRISLRDTRLISPRRLAVTTAALAGSEAVIAPALIAAAVMVIIGAAGATALALIALIAAALLTMVLAAGVATVVRRGISAPCACFGAPSTQPLGRQHVVRNLCLLAVQAAGLALAPLAHRPAAAMTVVAAGAGVVLALLFIRWEDLAALLAPVPPASPKQAPGSRARGGQTHG